MLDDNELKTCYDSLSPVLGQALDDVKWRLRKFLTDAPESLKDIYSASEVKSRIKPLESFLRKCRRESVDDVGAVPDAIEDLLGVRIVTASKPTARSLYEYFQERRGEWFCEVREDPRFVPYTPEDNNKYSLRSGYRAFHLTFVMQASYKPFTLTETWPVEIQIMSRLWDFWAEYSRRYFYLSDDPGTRQLLPYNVAISKILDTADDLITANLEALGRVGYQTGSADLGDAADARPHVDEATIAPDLVRSWFATNLTSYFGNAKMPNNFYLYKIAEELELYGIGVEDLTQIFEDIRVTGRYRAILDASNVHFLPPYQQILAKVLLYLDRDDETVVVHVNSRLGPLPVTLQSPRGTP